jgi:hypothetical protein
MDGIDRDALLRAAKSMDDDELAAYVRRLGNRATLGEPETEPDEGQNQADTGNASLLPSLSADDKRVAIITFAVTLAANVITAMLVGLALVAYHMQNVLFSYNKQHIPLPVWAQLTLAITILVPFTLSFTRKRIRHSRFAISVYLIAGAVCILGFTFLVFALLGDLLAVKS